MDFLEKCKNARAFIVLLAALIAQLLNLKYNRELIDSLVIVLAVIIIFYIISTVAIKFICKIRDMEGVKKVNISEDRDSEHDGEESSES